MYVGNLRIVSGDVDVPLKVEKFNLDIRDDGEVYVKFKQQFSEHYGGEASREEKVIDWLFNNQRKGGVFDVAGLSFQHKDNQFLKLDLVVDLRDGYIRFEDGVFTVRILGDHSFIVGDGKPRIVKS